MKAGCGDAALKLLHRVFVVPIPDGGLLIRYHAEQRGPLELSTENSVALPEMGVPVAVNYRAEDKPDHAESNKSVGDTIPNL